MDGILSNNNNTRPPKKTTGVIILYTNPVQTSCTMIFEEIPQNYHTFYLHCLRIPPKMGSIFQITENLRTWKWSSSKSWVNLLISDSLVNPKQRPARSSSARPPGTVKRILGSTIHNLWPVEMCQKVTWMSSWKQNSSKTPLDDDGYKFVGQ